MLRGWQAKGLALVWAYVPILLAPAVAQATIVQAGASPEEDTRREEESHLAGAKFPCVTAIYMLGTRDWPPVTSGTGTFIGTSRDGKKGLVLTAAHIFHYRPEEGRAHGYQRIAVSFGPDLKSFRAVDAERVFLHPDFSLVVPGHFRGSEGEVAALTPGNDVAIVQFDLEHHAKALAELGVTAAILGEDRECWSHPGLEAKTVGFGVFGTTSGRVDDQNVRVHAGDTLVSHGELRGKNLFMNWSPMSQEASDLLDAKTMAPGLLNRFATLDSRVEVRERGDAKPRRMETHKDQVAPAEGDSGGPLFIDTREGPRVVGLFTRSEHCQVLRGDNGKKLWSMAALWEPVVDHLPWIRGIRDGLEGKAQVLVPGSGHWECEGMASPGPTGDATNFEAQVPASKEDRSSSVKGRCKFRCIIM
jgi:hypothetical protein